MKLTPPNRNPDAHRHLRSDLMTAETDGDLVVLDSEQKRWHVLTGGAVFVWIELADQSTDGLFERMAVRCEIPTSSIATDVERTLDEFSALDLFEHTSP